MPHHLTLDLSKPVTLRGITCLPRQDQGNGRIAQVEIYCSTGPVLSGEPKATARWTNTAGLQTVLFEQPVEARYLKLLIKSEFNNNPFASLAELDVLIKIAMRLSRWDRFAGRLASILECGVQRRFPSQACLARPANRRADPRRSRRIHLGPASVRLHLCNPESCGCALSPKIERLALRRHQGRSVRTQDFSLDR